MNKTEYRTVSTAPEARAEENGTKQIRGTAAIVGVETIIGNYFIEEIAPGAFDDVLNDDTRVLFNHDQNAVLGRTTAGTARLSLDPDGHLIYEADISDNNTTARDVYDMIQRGDVSQSSFAFKVKEQKWFWGENGAMDKRIITKFSELSDVSPVTFPAYQATSVEAARSQHAEARSAAGLDTPTPEPTNYHEYKLKFLKYV